MEVLFVLVLSLLITILYAKVLLKLVKCEAKRREDSPVQKRYLELKNERLRHKTSTEIDKLIKAIVIFIVIIIWLSVLRGCNYCSPDNIRGVQDSIFQERWQQFEERNQRINSCPPGPQPC